MFLLVLLLACGASVALHRILTTGKIRQWANKEPEKLRIEYASASGWVPWDIHVTGFELRNRDPNVEFYFRLDDARVSFSIFALLSHELRFTRVRGSGLDYRLRIRPDPTLKAEDHFAALPQIPGFPERPLVAHEDTPSQKSEGGQKPAPPAVAPPSTPASAPASEPSSESREDRSSRPFRLKFDDLHIDAVRQVWIDIYRYRGAGTLDGSFDLLPRRHAQVGPARLALSGDLTLGKHTIARHADFEVNAVIAQFDPRSVRGNAVWPFITGRIRLDGPLAGLEFLNYLIDGEPRLSGGAGTVRLALAVEKGIGKGSLALSSKGVHARYAKSELRSDAAFRIRIDPWTFEKDRIDFSGSHIELTHAAEGGTGPDSRWWGKFDLPSADIQPHRAAVFQTRVSLNCRDARPLFTLFDTDLPGWARGILKLEGIEATARFAAGKSLLEIEKLDAKGGSFRIRGHYRVKKPAKTGAFLVETGVLAVGLEIEGPSSKLKLLGAKSWYEGREAEGGRR